MGKRGGRSRAPIGVSRSRNPMSLREESAGKRKIKDSGGSNKPFLKLEHLQKLAVWASGEASIPSLGAFFGHQLAATAESLGVSPDSCFFPCQRCETILQPGFNCTIRVETNKSKAPRHGQKQSNNRKNWIQNNVVYTCHFCSNRNMKRGTQRGHIKALCPSKHNTPSISKPNFTLQKSLSNEIRIESEETSEKESDRTSNMTVNGILVADIPVAKTGRTLLDGKRERKKSVGKKQNDPKSSSGQVNRDGCSTNKRRRKSWTSLKEIAQSSELSKQQTLCKAKLDLAVPCSSS